MWNLADTEFYALWTSRTNDVLPLPFTFTSRASGGREFEAELINAGASLSEKAGRSLDPVIDALQRPDLTVTVCGWDETDLMRPDAQVRVLGARRGPHGYVVKCSMGETYWYDRRYLITVCDPLRLADEVVAALPDFKPGTRGDITLESSRSNGPEDSFRASSIKDSMVVSTVDRAREFERLPTNGVGEIIISQGESVFGPRGIKQHELRWRDIQDDGRYVITDQDPPVAIAADDQRTVGLINSGIASVIRVIKEEREMRR
ncbi:ESX secretion-associated protein EspG [Nocardia tengchongensis]|uniref:ESX secretion-associated protein EspG n=1 Tax=Nocardia tengchongensis TaxID=2055889 RepID=UPI0036A1857A